MLRLLFCIVAAVFSLAATVDAAPLDILSGSAVQSSPPVPRYARYEPRKAAFPLSSARQQPALQGPARVYLMRGFLNIFSLGMDDLGAQIQADGIAATVTNHADADAIVSQIVTRYRGGDHGPIILIGHSLGADATIAMAQALDQYNIPVALVILFDGTAPHNVPANVATAINFTKAFDLAPAAGFRGALSNVDLSDDGGIDHFTIDKSPDLQARALNYIIAAATATPGASAQRR